MAHSVKTGFYLVELNDLIVLQDHEGIAVAQDVEMMGSGHQTFPTQGCTCSLENVLVLNRGKCVLPKDKWFLFLCGGAYLYQRSYIPTRHTKLTMFKATVCHLLRWLSKSSKSNKNSARFYLFPTVYFF